jgi:hypothetical protein
VEKTPLTLGVIGIDYRYAAAIPAREFLCKLTHITQYCKQGQPQGYPFEEMLSAPYERFSSLAIIDIELHGNPIKRFTALVYRRKAMYKSLSICAVSMGETQPLPDAMSVPLDTYNRGYPDSIAKSFKSAYAHNSTIES